MPMVFPLKLAPFEEYMLHDDRRDYPMCHFYRLRFAGNLDPLRFEAALTEAIAQHPLLRATVARSGRNR
jgi:hypothetical protein